jgi:hypothetical protein
VKRIEASSIQLGVLEIVLPTAGEPRCYIFRDLTDLLGVEYNSEALDRFRREWTTQGKRGRLDLDREADAVSIYGGREAILEAALLIYDLAVPSVTRPTTAEVEQARAAIKRFKRPPQIPWAVGDVFAAPLLDGSFAVGHVVWEATFAEGFSVRAPTVALLALRATDLDGVDLDDAMTTRTLAVLHVQSDSLDSGAWRVLGRRPVVIDPFCGPDGKPGEVGSTSWDGFDILANAWHGLEPWNRFFRTDFLDQHLLRGIQRPASVVMLTAEERIARQLPGDDDAAYKLFARQRR